MSVIAETAAQYALVEGFFSTAQQRALDDVDDVAFDIAAVHRARNVQIHFLYLFTRFERSVNEAIERVLAHRRSDSLSWSDRRIWEAWARSDLKDIAFMSRVEILIEKSRADYAYVLQLYRSRNGIGHGGEWTQPYEIADVASRMDLIVSSFSVT